MGRENQISTLGDLGISGRDFADTYNRQDLYRLYAGASNLEGCSPAEVADSLIGSGEESYDRRILIRSLVWKWQNGQRPMMVQALMKLHIAGIFRSNVHLEYAPAVHRNNLFPVNELDIFDFKNPNFVACCLLASIQYWRGSLSKYAVRRSGVRGQISDTQDSRFLLSTIVKLVNAIRKTSDCSLHVRDVDLPAELSRMLKLIGSTMARKSNAGLNIPTYVELALKTLSSPHVSKMEMVVAGEILNDFVMCFLALRACPTIPQKITACMIGAGSEDWARLSLELLSKVIDASEFDFEFTSAIQPPDTHSRIFIPRLRSVEKFTQGDLVALREQLKARILAVVEAIN